VARYDTTLMRNIAREIPAPDLRLPNWARRTNPVVRRHLGIYAKTVPPQIWPFVQLYLLQAALVLLTLPFPFIFNVTLPLITVSILILPLTLYIYGQILFMVGITAAITMVSELRNNTLHLLMTTPLSLQQILLGKIAASLWRRIDDLTLVALSVICFSLPPIVLEYANLWPPEDYPYVAHLLMILVLGSCIVRVALEPFMVAALGVLAGAAAPVRSVAITTTLILTAFYYLLINLPRLLPLSWPMRLMVEVALPLVLPVVITLGALRFASYLLTRD
jgi:ABC-type Na+ efflux pump permease subunit